MEKLEDIAMYIISYAGEARNKLYAALDACAENDFDRAEKNIEEATEDIIKAQKRQFKLLQKEAKGERIVPTILFIHAQDILIMSMVEKDLIQKIVELSKKRALTF